MEKWIEQNDSTHLKKIDQRIFLFENEKIFGIFLCTESESESEHKNCI